MKNNFPSTGWTPSRCYDVREENPRASLHECDFCGTEIRYVHVVSHPDEGQAEIGSECASHLDDRDEIEINDKRMRKRGSSRLSMMSDTHWHPAYGSETALRKIHRSIDYIIAPSIDGFRASYRLPTASEAVRLRIKTHDITRARHALYNAAEAALAPWRAMRGMD